MEILCQLVQSHHLSPEDFTPQQFQLADGTQVDLPRPPGHEILEHMLNDSLLLKKVCAAVVVSGVVVCSGPDCFLFTFLKNSVICVCLCAVE